MHSTAAVRSRLAGRSAEPSSVRAASRAGRLELGIAAGLLLAIALVVFGPHAIENGFTNDDWSNSASVQYPVGGVLADYWNLTSYRPVLVVYMPLSHMILGEHPWLHHMWSIVLAVGVSALLYAVLRRLRIGPHHAFAIAALVLLLPAANSAVLWPTASHIHLAIGLGLGGLLLALRGLDARGAGRSGRGRWLHAGAAAMYASSVLTYEIAAPTLLALGALYVTHAPWRAARIRWAVDVAVIVPCLAWTAIRSPREVLPLDLMVDHARALADQSVTVFARSALPFGQVGRQTVVLGLLAVVVAAALVRWLLPKRDDARPVLGRWLAILAAGVLVALAGWVMYIPADPYYSLDRGGVDNRTNALAAIGVAMAIYAAIVLGSTLLFRGVPEWTRLAALCAGGIAVLIGLGYAGDQRRDVAAWGRADDAAKKVLDAVGRAVPDAPRNATFYTFGQAAHETTGITIFAYPWDLRGAVRVTFDDPTLSAYPVTELNPMSCRRDGVGPAGAGWDPNGEGTQYGQAIFVDVPSGANRRIDSRGECKAALRRLEPGPWIRVPG